jgi:hypothetical protein
LQGVAFDISEALSGAQEGLLNEPVVTARLEEELAPRATASMTIVFLPTQLRRRPAWTSPRVMVPASDVGADYYEGPAGAGRKRGSAFGERRRPRPVGRASSMLRVQSATRRRSPPRVPVANAARDHRVPSTRVTCSTRPPAPGSRSPRSPFTLLRLPFHANRPGASATPAAHEEMIIRRDVSVPHASSCRLPAVGAGAAAPHIDKMVSEPHGSCCYERSDHARLGFTMGVDREQ